MIRSVLRVRAGAAASLAFALAVLAPGALLAQELEPRSYANLPIGLNFLVAGYGYTQGGLATDPAGPIAGAYVTGHSAVAAYAHAFSLLGSAAKVDAIFSHSWIEGDATVAGEARERRVSGFSDPRFRITWNFLGAPALSMQEFAGYEQDIIVGASLQVSVPVGQYDADKLVNLGKNRWFIKSEIGISKTWGPLTVELAPSVTVFTKNDDYFGGATREQDPIFAVQGHAIMSFGGGAWGALDATFLTGGQSTVDGVENDDRQRTWRVGVTLGLPIDRQHSIKIYGSTGVATRTGFDFEAIGVVWQYRW